MNKGELIDAIAMEAGLTKVQAKKAVESYVNATTGALKNGEKVTLVGFGTFSIVERAARKGRNPQTRKEMTIPAKKVVRFRPGLELVEKVK
jgi:DNA-binding protein HU-beta